MQQNINRNNIGKFYGMSNGQRGHLQNIFIQVILKKPSQNPPEAYSRIEHIADTENIVTNTQKQK